MVFSQFCYDAVRRISLLGHGSLRSIERYLLSESSFPDKSIFLYKSCWLCSSHDVFFNSEKDECI